MNRQDDDLDDREFPDESDMDDSDEPAMFECPQCRKMIVEDTEWCHHCGYYLSREDAPRKSFWIIAIVVVIIGVLLIWSFR